MHSPNLSMDSQVTLVDLPCVDIPSAGHFAMDFSVDDVHNSTVRIRGQNLYTVQSNRDVSITRVYRTDGGFEPTLLALIERKDVVPDRVTIAGSKPMSARKFLKSSTFSRLYVIFLVITCDSMLTLSLAQW